MRGVHRQASEVEHPGMSKPTKPLKTKADALFGRLIRSRGACQRCGRTSSEVQLQCAHIVSRRFTATRWDENNALCLCAGCHRWGHDNPIEFTKFVTDLLGDEIVEGVLEQARNYTGTIKRVDYEELIAGLKEKVAALD